MRWDGTENKRRTKDAGADGTDDEACVDEGGGLDDVAATLPEPTSAVRLGHRLLGVVAVHAPGPSGAVVRAADGEGGEEEQDDGREHCGHISGCAGKRAKSPGLTHPEGRAVIGRRDVGPVIDAVFGDGPEDDVDDEGDQSDEEGEEGDERGEHAADDVAAQGEEERDGGDAGRDRVEDEGLGGHPDRLGHVVAKDLGRDVVPEPRVGARACKPEAGSASVSARHGLPGPAEDGRTTDAVAPLAELDLCADNVIGYAVGQDVLDDGLDALGEPDPEEADGVPDGCPDRDDDPVRVPGGSAMSSGVQGGGVWTYRRAVAAKRKRKPGARRATVMVAGRVLGRGGAVVVFDACLKQKTEHQDGEEGEDGEQREGGGHRQRATGASQTQGTQHGTVSRETEAQAAGHDDVGRDGKVALGACPASDARPGRRCGGSRAAAVLGFSVGSVYMVAGWVGGADTKEGTRGGPEQAEARARGGQLGKGAAELLRCKARSDRENFPGACWTTSRQADVEVSVPQEDLVNVCNPSQEDTQDAQQQASPFGQALQPISRSVADSGLIGCRVKTSKALQSKKGKAALAKLHPHSRRAQQLARVRPDRPMTP